MWVVSLLILVGIPLVVASAANSLGAGLLVLVTGLAIGHVLVILER